MIEKYEEDYEKIYLHKEIITKRCEFKYYIVFVDFNHFFSHCGSTEFLLFGFSYENNSYLQRRVVCCSYP